jgi:hypothetical protein
MSIHKIGSDLVRPLPSKETGPAERKAEGEANGSARKARADHVGFSAEGLAMAELAHSDRLATVEARIANGFYDDPQVADEVARRLLQSGDLDRLI